jgi:hypothetical protein
MNLLVDIAKYSLVWGLVLGFVTVFVAPFWLKMVESGGLHMVLTLVFLGSITKYYFMQEEDMRRNPRKYE